jgi:TAP-like protein
MIDTGGQTLTFCLLLNRWNNKLDTPMLIISNTADPITPRASGEEIHKLMGKSSRLLIQDSPGHCSLSSVSPCTLGWYRSYLVNGTLPENHFMCKVEGSYFKDPDAEKKAELKEDELLRLAHEIAKAWARFTSGLLLRDY